MADKAIHRPIQDEVKAALAEYPLVILRGDPGAGKSHIVDQLVAKEDIWRSEGRPIPLGFLRWLAERAGTELELRTTRAITFEEVFLIDESSLLVTHLGKSELDEDILSGMLSAVQSFVSDSFGGEDDGAGLGRLDYGERMILIEHSDSAYLAAVIDKAAGTEPAEYIRTTLNDIEARYGNLIRGWDGVSERIEPIIPLVEAMGERVFEVAMDLTGEEFSVAKFAAFEALRVSLMATGRQATLGLDSLAHLDLTSQEGLRYLVAAGALPPVLATIRTGAGQVADLAKESVDLGLARLLDLPGWSPTEVKDLIDARLEGTITVELSDFLVEKGGGNPTFTLEVLGLLMTRGRVFVRKGEWVLGPTDGLILPTGVIEALAERVDLRSRREIEVLEHAATIDGPFTVEVFSASTGIVDPGPALESLISSGLLRRNGLSYIMSGSLLQEAVYGAVSERWRGVLHGDIAVSLAEILENQDQDVYSIAHHASLGREPDLAISYSLRAAELATKALSPEEAIRHLDAALTWMAKVITSKAQVQEIQIKRTRLLGPLGQYEDMVAELARLEEGVEPGPLLAELRLLRLNALEQAGEYEDGLGLADLWLALGDLPGFTVHVRIQRLGFLMRMGDLDACIGACHQLLASTLLKDQLAAVLNTQGQALLRLGRMDEAAKVLREGLGGADGRRLADLQLNLGVVLYKTQDYPGAREAFEGALAIYEGLPDLHRMGTMSINIGNVIRRSGDLDGAMEVYQRARTIAERTGNRINLLHALNQIGIIHQRRGDQDSALAVYRRAAGLADQVGDTYMALGIRTNIGEIQCLQGKLDDAEAVFREGMAGAFAIGSKPIELLHLAGLVEVELTRGQAKGVATLIDRGLILALETQNKTLQAQFLRFQGMVASERGDPELAQQYLDQSLALLKDSGDAEGEYRNLLELARILRKAGDREGAARILADLIPKLEKAGLGELLADARGFQGS